MGWSDRPAWLQAWIAFVLTLLWWLPVFADSPQAVAIATVLVATLLFGASAVAPDWPRFLRHGCVGLMGIGVAAVLLGAVTWVGVGSDGYGFWTRAETAVMVGILVGVWMFAASGIAFVAQLVRLVATRA